MKRILGTALILLSTLFIGYSQQDNNSSDDVYYDDDQQVTSQPVTDDQSNTTDAPTYQTFYDQLSAYGSWVNYPGYGYCWVPNQSIVGPDFSPYMTNGNWVYSDLGWTWASDFAWGWGPFHYGRWFDDDYYGWIWEPGYDWAPAWVIWGDYGGYYGWACIGPGGVLSPHYRPDARYWHFVDHQYMGRPDWHDHINRGEVFGKGFDVNTHINIISHANTYGQSVFFSGPKAEEVEKYSGQKVNRVQISNSREPGQTKVTGNQINIYRPGINRSNAQHGAPAKVSTQQDFKPANRPQEQQRQQPQPQQRQQRSNFTPRQEAPTPPRQSTPQRQYSAPSQPAQRSFVPSSRPSYSAPSYSAPRGGGFSGGGGGSRGGGGGRR